MQARFDFTKGEVRPPEPRPRREAPRRVEKDSLPVEPIEAVRVVRPFMVCDVMLSYPDAPVFHACLRRVEHGIEDWHLYGTARHDLHERHGSDPLLAAMGRCDLVTTPDLGRTLTRCA